MTIEEINNKGEKELEESYFKVANLTNREKELMKIAYALGFTSGNIESINETLKFVRNESETNL